MCVFKIKVILYLLIEEKAHAEEKRSQWLTNQQERLQVLKNENIIPADGEVFV